MKRRENTLAFVEGHEVKHRDTDRDGLWSCLVVFQALGQDAKGERLGFHHCLFTGCAIRKNARQFRDFGDPTAVPFALVLDGEIHLGPPGAILRRPLFATERSRCAAVDERSEEGTASKRSALAAVRSNAWFGVRGLQQLAKLFDGETGIFDDTAHGESVDRIVTRDRQDTLAIAHDDVLGLTHDPEPGLLEGAHRIEMVDAGELGQV